MPGIDEAHSAPSSGLSSTIVVFPKVIQIVGPDIVSRKRHQHLFA
jgi:hypothetical protein